MNPNAFIEFPKSQYKKFIKDVVTGTLERSELIEETINKLLAKAIEDEDYEKASDLMPVTQQKEDRSWKASNLSYLVPYADVVAPVKAAIQRFRQGKDADQDVTDLFAQSAKAFVVRSLEPFLAPSIMAETALELTPDSKGIFRNKNGGVIADIKNDPDWFSKLMYHTYKKITPTTIRSAEEIMQAVGGDLSKSGIKRDLFDTVAKIFTGFSVQKQDPYTAMRFKVGTYAGDIQRARQAFTNDISNHLFV